MKSICLKVCLVLMVFAVTGEVFSDGLYRVLPGWIETNPAHAGSPGKISNTGPVASVKASPVRKGTISETVVAYGTVVPSPGRIKTLSVAYESQIRAVYVTQGQEVFRGDRLLEIGPSPDTILKLETAINNYEAARERLRQTRGRIKLKLATNQELLQAEQTLQQARLQLKSLKERGIAKRITIFAHAGGVVARLLVHKDAIVPAGSPLMEIVDQGAMEVRLAVEPEDVHLIGPGHKVFMIPVNRPRQKEVIGKIRAVSRSINPSTRLLDVFVTVPSPPPLMLNEYVWGKIIVISRQALLVPRSAVLPEGGHFVLFTVKDGRAHKHLVTTGLESAGQIEITGDHIGAGDMVVTLGNYELKDGMKVKVEACQ